MIGHPDCAQGDCVNGNLNITENEYPYGKALRFYNLNDICEFKRIFLSKNLSLVTRSYLGNPCQENLQIFSSYEYKTIKEAGDKTRNSYWHFDPYYSLKYFIYLQDTNLDNGCTRVLPGTIPQTKKIRQQISFDEICKTGYNVEHLVDSTSQTGRFNRKKRRCVCIRY